MIGKVAKFQKGMTRLVISVHWTSRDTAIPLCKGVCLDPGRVGQPWQSIKPEWIGTLDDWVELRHTEIVELKREPMNGTPWENLARLTSDTPSRRNLLT